MLSTSCRTMTNGNSTYTERLDENGRRAACGGLFYYSPSASDVLSRKDSTCDVRVRDRGPRRVHPHAPYARQHDASAFQASTVRCPLCVFLPLRFLAPAYCIRHMSSSCYYLDALQPASLRWTPNCFRPKLIAEALMCGDQEFKRFFKFWSCSISLDLLLSGDYGASLLPSSCS